MEEFNAPAVFLSPAITCKKEKLLVDVAFREGRKRGKTEEVIRSAVAGYKWRKTEEVEFELKKSLEPTRYSRSAIWIGLHSE